ncbi:MAG: hypothetical protein ACPLOU_06020 [bacterium]
MDPVSVGEVKGMLPLSGGIEGEGLPHPQRRIPQSIVIKEREIYLAGGFAFTMD